jgi:hypothetical protein
MRSILLFAGWLLVCAFGLVALAAQAGKSGESAGAPATWPVSARVPKAAGRPTLLLFAHPRCACTRATMRELERLLARAKDKPDVTVVLAPGGEAPGTIPGARVFRDDGTEAARFSARTSGQVVIYGRDGKLAYSGGVTPSRGHEGDSRGRDLALLALSGTGSKESSADVFGCGLAKKE